MIHKVLPGSLHFLHVLETSPLQAVKKKLGVLPNIFTTFAQSPAALNGYLQLAESLAGGRLSARQREQIALAVAQENACQYCSGVCVCAKKLPAPPTAALATVNGSPGIRFSIFLSG